VEIVRINGADSQDIIRRMRAMQEIDGYNSTFEDRSIQKSFRTYFLFLYGRSESYEVHYLSVAQDTLQISLAGGVRKPKEEAAASEPATLSMTGAEFYLLEDNVGYLDLNSFSSDGYKKFYKSVFAQIAERSVEYLVLDLRGNGGGYFPNGNRLLAYLLEEDFEMKFSRPKQSIENDTHLDLPISSKMTNALFGIIPDRKDDDPHRNYSIKYKVKSKNAYRGKLYVLIDGGSFSMSGLVATRLKHASEAVFIGAETGGGEDGSNAIIRYMLTLPETQIRVMVPFYFMDHDVAPATKGRGVFPDYEINYSIEEVLSGKDKELQKVRALIEASR
ncbi:MAG: S41 family peptidase, partial [Bacteroidota bacterium]